MVLPNTERSPERDRAIPGRPDPEHRAEHDFYRTPPVAVETLLKVERFYGTVWEPACGDGAISEVLKRRGLSVISTDLIDYGYGAGTLDFLHGTPPPGVNCIITNPPFKLAQQFAERAIAVADGKVALLCRLLWLASQRRRTLFESSPLARVWVFSKRINFNRDNEARFADGRSGMVDYCWLVWEHGHVGSPELKWLPPH